VHRLVQGGYEGCVSSSELTLNSNRICRHPMNERHTDVQVICIQRIVRWGNAPYDAQRRLDITERERLDKQTILGGQIRRNKGISEFECVGCHKATRSRKVQKVLIEESP